MSKDQQAAKYNGGLKYRIQEQVVLHNVFSVDEAHNLFESRKVIESTIFQAGGKSADQSKEKQPVIPQGRFPTASSSAGSSTTWKTRDVAKKDNPYAKPVAIKCY